MDLLEVKFWDLQDNNKESQNVIKNNSYYTECVHTFVLSGLLLLLSCVWVFATPWTAARQASLSFTISQSLLRLVHWVSDAIQPSHPLSSPSPPALNLPQHLGLFQSWLCTSGGQSIRTSASASVLPVNFQGGGDRWQKCV